MKIDFLIVGAGFFGSTFAHIAKQNHKTCLVIDKSNHVAGKCYDFAYQDYYIGQYGAHIFHTNDEFIWKFVNRFTEMTPFINKPKVFYQNKVYSFPVNLMTLNQLWGVTHPEQAKRELESRRLKIDNPRNFEECMLSKVGEEIYQKFFYGYTKKHWLKNPSQLPASIAQRLPIRFSYNENYFSTKYQAIPKDGYTKLVNNMLDGIPVILNENFSERVDKWRSCCEKIIYSGSIDELINYEYGRLEYRELEFKHKTTKTEFQGNPVFNYTEYSVPYLRSIENRLFYTNENKNTTNNIITFDYSVNPENISDPMYPINTEVNNRLYSRCLKSLDSQFIIGGRIGSYKYLDIDQSIGLAIRRAKSLGLTIY